MKFGFLILRDDVGGTIVYMKRLARGLEKIGHDVVVVSPLKGSGIGMKRVFQSAGWDEAEVVGYADIIADELNSCDFIVASRPGNIDDFKRDEDSSLPWYYEIFDHLDPIPMCTFLHETKSYGRYAPYMDIWESYSCFVATNKSSLANSYTEERGNVPAFVVPIPIAVPNPDEINFKKMRSIVSTSRFVSSKRHAYILKVLHDIASDCPPGLKHGLKMGQTYWSYSAFSAFYDHFFLQRVKKNYSGAFPLCYIRALEAEEDRKLKYEELPIDDIFRDAALVFNSYRLPPGDEGGMENSTLEGAVRGAVPLITKDWAAPYPDAPPREGVYLWEMHDKKDASNLKEVLDSIDPNSQEFFRKQMVIREYINEEKRDTTVAHKFVKLARRFV